MEAMAPSREIQEILRRLRSIEAALQELRERVDRLEATTQITAKPPIAIDNTLRIPDSLRKTMATIAQLGEAPAEVIAERTHRTRGMESIYLNQLARMGYIQKIKRGRRIHFRALSKAKVATRVKS
jgi:predicted transcriptional regulator